MGPYGITWAHGPGHLPLIRRVGPWCLFFLVGKNACGKMCEGIAPVRKNDLTIFGIAEIIDFSSVGYG